MARFVSVFTKVNAGTLWRLLTILSILMALALWFHHCYKGTFKTTLNYTNIASDYTELY